MDIAICHDCSKTTKGAKNIGQDSNSTRSRPGTTRDRRKWCATSEAPKGLEGSANVSLTRISNEAALDHVHDLQDGLCRRGKNPGLDVKLAERKIRTSHG